MPKYLLKITIFALAVLTVVMCSKKEKKETILEGKIAIWSDETITPVIEDQVMVFESQYNAQIDLISKSETEVVNALINNAAKVAILSRNLTDEEKKSFASKNIFPKITKFATDGVAFIVNKKEGDTLIDLNDVLEVMRGKSVPSIKGLAFDNPNSSTVRYLNQLAGIKVNPSNIYSFNNNVEAIKYVAQNEGIVGVIGLNWLSQPSPEMEPFMNEISVVSVKGKGDKYYYPSQNNLAEGTYPLARDLFVVNCQGFSGLGMGFASFVAGERGQRIILKSGLLPTRIPGRKIAIKK